MIRKGLIAVLVLAGAGAAFLEVIMPSCIHPLRGGIVICGQGLHIRLTEVHDAPRLCLPFWWLAILFAVYPVLVLVRGSLLRWRRRKPGLCPKCGYNLRGNVSGACPECGTKLETP